MKQDNLTFRQKLALRREMLKHLTDPPVIMETHGGLGKLFMSCYRHVESGVVFERDPDRAAVLSQQRPTWAVYEGDAEAAIGQGGGSHLMVNVLDIDPYGQPWPVIDAFFKSDRPRAASLFVAVNDGLRQHTRLKKGVANESLSEAVIEFGENLFPVYLDVCRWLMEQKAGQAGYGLTRWAGYYCGKFKNMTHYLARLELN